MGAKKKAARKNVVDPKGGGKKQLTRRVDALTLAAEQLDARSAGVERQLRELGETQAVLGEQATRLAQRVTELAEQTSGTVDAARRAIQSSRDTQSRLQALAADFV